ncbi:MAG: PTS sugar transporter subunit IIB [Defluviitaleaceae bacterium]|nr:PTS sugar transporter subunit IIB [Defluviitaleaceae bacterium]
MKKMLIMCGTGMITSTIAITKITEWLKSKGYDKEITIFQSKILTEVNKVDDYDIVISTTLVPNSIKDKVIVAIPLITGMGTEAIFEQIEEKIKEKIKS